MPSGELKKIEIRPGIVRNVTEYSAEGYYVDGDKVRFRDGRAEKIGGWVPEIVEQNDDSTDNSFTGVCRNLHAWVDLDDVRYLALGTHEKLELLSGGKYYDITPVESSAVVSNAISTSVGSTEVIVSDPSHGAASGDYVIFSSLASTVAGVYLDGEYVISSVTGADSYIIDSGTTAAATTVSQGGDLTIDYLLETGNEDNAAAYGWGAGTWGTPGASASAGWNQPRTGTLTEDLRQWSLDNWGEDLIACPRGGKIYTWDATNGEETRAVQISAAPSVNNLALVAQPTRHLVAMGTHNVSGVFDPLLVRWSDGENFNDFIASAGNDAGSFRLKGGNYIVGAVQSKREIMIFTDSALHSMRFVGGEFIFGFDQMGSNCGLIGQQGVIDVNGVALWMGYNSFFIYDGAVRNLDSTVDDAVFDVDSSLAVNFEQKEKVFAAHNPDFNEVTWFYPTQTTTENNRYVTYNYEENIWYDGWMDRTAWVDNGIFEKPYATNPSGTLYIHETGKNDGSNPMGAFVQTAPMDISDGDSLMFVDRIVPDFRIPDNKTLNIEVKFKKYLGDDFTTKGPFTVSAGTGKVSMRGRGRHAAVRYSTSITGGDFEVGDVRFGVRPDGMR